MPAMSDSYTSLLDAVIAHLEELKADGSKFVSVGPEVLAALAAPVSRTPTVAAPAAASVTATGRTTVALGAERTTPRPQATPPPAEPPRAPAPPAAPVFAPAPKPIFSTPTPVPAVATPAAAKVPSSPRGEVFNSPVLPPTEKLAALAELRARVLACEKCPQLVATRTQVVFGVGNPEATLMFVGEAPGADEDRLGEPFVGAAGELLTKIIRAMGFTRETVYIANILKCRPDTPGQSSGNRKPTPEEMATCAPYLLTQIELVRPQVLVALGATATTGLLGLTEGITRLRGNWQTFRGLPVMPTYHPAYLIHNPDNREKRKVWEDMLQVMAKLGLPISDKQRGYFQNT